MTDLTNQLKSNQPHLRIVVADDHALVRGGLALLIGMASPNSEIIEASNFEQVTEILSQQDSIDLMLLDLMMPGMDREKSISTICHTWPDVPIIIVSVNEDSGTIKRALAVGAMGYIPKTSSPDVTISAIQLVLAGGVYVPPHILQQGSNLSAYSAEESGSGIQIVAAQITALSRRQLEVIDLIVSGKSNQTIADELGLTLPTVKMHVSAAFKKLNVKNRTEAVAKYSKLRRATQLH